MYIIWDKYTSWERQYIIQDLLQEDPETYEKIIEANDKLDYNNFEKWSNHEKLKEITNNNIIVFNSTNRDYNVIFNIVKLLKPKIIFNLSDETGRREIFQELAKYTKILFRQYHHFHYKQYSNIHHMPLGYMNGMLENDYMNIKLKAPDKRKYTWSFIGSIRQNRVNMISVMSQISPFIVSSGLSPTEMKDIYRNSVFVTNERGWCVLDCFRLYEASLCGAIPVVVGNINEINATFMKHDNPPWLFCTSWEAAVNKCKELFKDKNTIRELSKKNIEWWNKKINSIRKLIKDNLC